jgi:hypothetical protein
MGGGQSFDLPSPEDIDGPPTPGTFKQLFALSDAQAGQYGHGWDSLMAETTPQRDSARAARQTMRSAFQDHDREAAQQQAKVLERLGKDLHKRDEAFDKSLAFLTKDQQKQYDDWKKEQKKAREDERRQRFGGNGASGVEPPSRPPSRCRRRSCRPLPRRHRRRARRGDVRSRNESASPRVCLVCPIQSW